MGNSIPTASSQKSLAPLAAGLASLVPRAPARSLRSLAGTPWDTLRSPRERSFARFTRSRGRRSRVMWPRRLAVPLVGLGQFGRFVDLESARWERLQRGSGIPQPVGVRGAEYYVALPPGTALWCRRLEGTRPNAILGGLIEVPPSESFYRQRITAVPRRTRTVHGAGGTRPRVTGTPGW